MQFNNAFGSKCEYRLSSAILIYHRATDSHGDTSQGAHLATIHDVALDRNGKATVGPGRSATLDAVQQLSLSLSNRVGQAEGLFPPQLLSLSLTRMVWHRPAAPAEMWFKLSHGDAKKRARLEKLSGEKFPQPHLVFVASAKKLAVYAVATAGRPTADTPLYYAPHFNVYESGRMCAGTARLPESIGPELIPEFEKGFFASNFTHTTHHVCNHPGGPGTMWMELAGKPSFPRRLLRNANRTLASIFTQPARLHPNDDE